MRPEARRWVVELVASALELPPEKRASFLAESCDDERVRREAERILADKTAAEEFLERPAADVLGGATDTPDDPAIGSLIGPYRIERVIGSGGMGVVYQAIRDDREYERRVAVKLLQPGLPHHDLVERFRNERQILAALEHPNIAGLLDGGTTSDGRPYLVMEFIDGRPVDRYVAEHDLPVKDRLQLFRKVCTAVAFAHRNLIVHRDLKPSNILVTDDGEPKLLDFGIAKLLDPASIPGSDDLTRSGMRAMSPNYASPEQIVGRPITTASDVYSLGVVLYQLLTGELPRRFDDYSLASMDREFERQPTAPSAAIRGESPRVARRLEGDIDAIVLKSLRDEPEHRYPSVDDLDDDLRRHLNEEPVSARRGTFFYRTGKLLRRHAFGAAAIGLVVSLAVSFTAAVIVQQRRTAHERDRAAQIADFMISIFEESSPEMSGDSNVNVREVLARGSQRIEQEFADFPDTQADLLLSVGRVYSHLGLQTDAVPLLRRCVSLRESSGGTSSPELPEALNELSNVLMELGDSEEPRALLDRAAEISRSLGRNGRGELVYSLRLLGRRSAILAEYEIAIGYFEEALETAERSFGADSYEVAGVLAEAAMAESDLGRYQQSEAHSLRAIEIFSSGAEPRHAELLVSLTNLGNDYWLMGRYPEAAEYIGRAIEIHERIADPDDPNMGTLLNNLANVYADQGEIEKSISMYRRSLEVKLRGYDETSPTVLATRHNLAFGLYDLGRVDEARVQWLGVLSGCREVMPDSPRTAVVLHSLARVEHILGRDRAAEDHIGESLGILEKTVDVGHRSLVFATMTQSRFRLAAGNPAEAETLLRRIPTGPGAGGDSGPAKWHAEALRHLAEILIVTGRLDEAVKTLDRAREITGDLIEKEPSRSLDLLSAALHITNGDLFRIRGDHAGARASWARSMELLAQGETGTIGAQHRILNVATLLRLGRPEDARSDAEYLMNLGWQRPQWLQLALEPDIRPEDVPVPLY
jgi:serine/threonine protein kinase/tetratricopeptide (TPR) repeat protein